LKSEVIPEYAECIKINENYPKTSVIGRVYKVEGETATKSDWLISFNGENYPSVDKKRFKPSTKEAYEAQFKKEKDVKKEQAVIIENKEQWNFALNIIRNGKKLYSYISDTCLNTDNGCYCSKEYYEQEGYEVISFEKWCEQENIVNPFKEKIKQLELKIGKWYTCIDIPNSIICNRGNNKGYGMWDYYWKFSPTAYFIGTTSEWKELSDKEVEERLLKYAKEHYPVGTKFKSAYTSNQTYEVETNNYFMWKGLTGVVVDEPSGVSIYHEGKWAEIISKPEVKSNKFPPVGTRVKLLKGINGCTGANGLTGIVTDEKGTNGLIHSNEGFNVLTDNNQIWTFNGTWKEVKSEEPPCKVGDYLYIIDVTKDGENPHKEAYSGDIIEITNIYKEKDNPKYGDWWVSHKPNSFSGGGFRIGGNGYQWNKHIRLATGYEIMPKLSQDYPLLYEQAVQTGRVILGAFKEKPKLKLKSNNKKVIISKKHVQVSNKHLI
jgi:hypothetical protein